MASYPQPPEAVLQRLQTGIAIPAHPLALTAERKLDERRQQGLSNYYLHAGAGGLAVGVHTTQFEIREPQYAMLEPVLALGAEAARNFDHSGLGDSPAVLVAGICGKTDQAVREAELARELGYHVGLLSLAALGDETEDELITHVHRVASELPVFGFYLQPAVGGRLLSYRFWRQFAEIPNVVAIKVAAFNRYQTLDVLRAVAESSRHDQIALYTGNDDTIVFDLLSRYTFDCGTERRVVEFSGGLLGHWACWTRCATELLRRCQSAKTQPSAQAYRELIQLAGSVTDMNAAIFDAANGFQGCIPGVHEVLRRQGLLDSGVCLDTACRLSQGQAEEISRVTSSYPELVDDDFVRDHLESWLA